MRALDIVVTAALVSITALSVAVGVSAQAKTDEDYDKVMKGVGAANGAMRKATEPDAIAAEAKKLEALFKDVNQFWAGRNNKEAADWATAAMNHAVAIQKAAMAKNTEGIAAAQKELGGVCQTCHTKNREKTETGFAIKKG